MSLIHSVHLHFDVTLHPQFNNSIESIITLSTQPRRLTLKNKWPKFIVVHSTIGLHSDS